MTITAILIYVYPKGGGHKRLAWTLWKKENYEKYYEKIMTVIEIYIITADIYINIHINLDINVCNNKWSHWQ